ncbi:MAG: Tm-1-like ATP-binding domain-containing protein [Desulfatiglandales bacterium]
MSQKHEKAIAIIATLDTKGPEAGYVKSCIEDAGYGSLVLDTGILDRKDPSSPVPDISADEIAKEGGEDRMELVSRSSEKGIRDRGIRAMAKGSAQILSQLYKNGRIRGVVGLGGAQGTEICAAAMRALPLGVPKVMVSTVASGQTPFGIYTGTRDLTMMHSVVDILGLNSLTRRILANAAGAVVGMAEVSLQERESTRRRVGITIYGQTTPAGMAIKDLLESKGYEVFTFHSNGTGGQAMEELAVEGLLDALFDLSTHELSDELFGGIHAGDTERLLAGGLKGVPRLVLPGALDVITLREPETIPEVFRSQPFAPHNPHITLVRANAEQMTRLATVMAERLNQAVGPVAVAIPKGGFSFYNRDGLHFRDLEADKAFVHTLKSKLKPEIPIHEFEMHVNDPPFVTEIVSLFEAFLERAETEEGSVKS